jgi:hypothetical protein
LPQDPLSLPPFSPRCMAVLPRWRRIAARRGHETVAHGYSRRAHGVGQPDVGSNGSRISRCSYAVSTLNLDGIMVNWARVGPRQCYYGYTARRGVTRARRSMHRARPSPCARRPRDGSW